MNKTGREQTIVPIQVLRAVAALAVVVTHIQFDLTRLAGLPDAFPNLSLGNAGVDLFFVISGFVMVYASEPLFGRRSGPTIFFTHRMIRIVPLYWLVTTLYLVVTLAAPTFNKVYPPEFVAASYLFIPIPRPDGIMQPLVGQGWTLNYEMLFYVLFALAVIMPRRVAVAVASFALIVAVTIGRLSGPLPPIAAYWTDPILLEFVFGMLIGLAYREGVKLPPLLAWSFLGAGTLLLFLFEHVMIGAFEMRAIGWGIPASLIVIGSTFGRLAAIGPVWRALGVIGNGSYALYLLHVVPIRVILYAARWLGVDLESARWLYFAAAIVASVALAIAIHYLFERPVGRTLRRFTDYLESARQKRYRTKLVEPFETGP